MVSQPPTGPRARTALLAVAVVAAGGAAASACATLGQALQPPAISAASGRSAELRLLGPSTQHPLGAASVRLWAHVSNPNPLSLTLAALSGGLYLSDTHAADVDFPLGLPLRAAQDTVIPLDISVGFSEIPALANLARQWLSGQDVPYRLEGTMSVDAGALGQPSFGPMTLLQGEVPVRR